MKVNLTFKNHEFANEIKIGIRPAKRYNKIPNSEVRCVDLYWLESVTLERLPTALLNDLDSRKHCLSELNGVTLEKTSLSH